MTEDPIIIETSPLVCTANQWADFCMKGTTVMKELTSNRTTIVPTYPKVSQRGKYAIFYIGKNFFCQNAAVSHANAQKLY